MVSCGPYQRSSSSWVSSCEAAGLRAGRGERGPGTWKNRLMEKIYRYEREPYRRELEVEVLE
ncbi:MAG: hypothetical protein WBG49_07170, partial [Thermoanaerobaculia bacterium]